jgi:hypothetical protein
MKYSPLLPCKQFNNSNSPHTPMPDTKTRLAVHSFYTCFSAVAYLYHTSFVIHHRNFVAVIMSFNVYLVDYMGMLRNHHCIFVETHEDGPKTGYVYQVTGNIQTGMIHEHRKAEQPEISNNFGGLKRLIGTVPSNNYVNIRIAVNSIPPPKKQFDGPKKIYPDEPLRRCQEWTYEAIQTLIDRGILQLPISGSPASSPHWIYSDK